MPTDSTDLEAAGPVRKASDSLPVPLGGRSPCDSRSPCGDRPCENACGWTAFQGFDTCCKSCHGPNGPHARDCAKKNFRLSLKKRLRLLSKDEQKREAQQQQLAIAEVKKARSGPELVEFLSTFIEEDWLHELDPIQGNIYRSAAFGIVRLPTCAELRWMMRSPWSSSAGQSQFLGSVCVWVIQVLAPLVLQAYYLTDGHTMHFSGPAGEGRQGGGTKLMGALFLMIFCLNARYEVAQEAEAWECVSSLWQFLKVSEKSQTHGSVLLIGPFTKCWIYLSTCWITMMMVGISEEPKDVLFDSLALFFLYNLDKLGGDLAFLPDVKWPGKQFAFLHQWLLRDETGDQLPDPGWGKHVYRVTSVILMLMNFILPILYFFAVWRVDEEEPGGAR